MQQSWKICGRAGTQSVGVTAPMAEVAAAEMASAMAAVIAAGVVEVAAAAVAAAVLVGLGVAS